MDPVAILDSHLNYHEAANNCNIFSHYLGHPCEAWCFDTVTACYQMSGHKLPPMQPGVATGAASVWYGFTWAEKNNLVVPSWDAKRNDAVCFGWEGKGIHGNPDQMHVALVVSSGPKGSTLTYEGGNQKDHVSRQTIEVGSPLIMGIISLHKFLPTAVPAIPSHKAAPAPHPSPNPRPHVTPHAESVDKKMGVWGPKWPVAFMVKTPLVTSSVIGAFQERMIARGWRKVPAGTPYSHNAGHPFKVDHIYGNDTAAVVWAFQHEKGLTMDGKLSAATWLQAARTDNVTAR